MARMLSTSAEFERDIIRERVKAGIANARDKGKPHGRPKTASLKIAEILQLKAEGYNNSQIAEKLKISRGSVIKLLKRQIIPKPEIFVRLRKTKCRRPRFLPVVRLVVLRLTSKDEAIICKSFQID